VAKKAEAEIESNNGFNLSAFFQSIKEELDKVTWPTRQQLISESAAVLLMVTLSASLIYFVDWLFGLLSQALFATGQV
jgi:preprotein translocase subunit SecE